MTETIYPKLKEREFKTVLSNGLTVSVIPKPGFAKAFAMLAVGYGALDATFESDGKMFAPPIGVAHFLEHKVFEQPDGGNALQAFAQTGASPNAFTSKDMTAYHFSCTDHFTHNLELLLDFVSTPYFTDENVAKEQGIIAQEIGMVNDNPDWRVYENLMRTMFEGHPAADSVIGTVESIESITRNTLFTCYNAFYRPSNMILTIAGDVSPEEVCYAAETILSKVYKAPPKRQRFVDWKGTPATRIEEQMDVPTPVFALGYQVPMDVYGPDAARIRILADLAVELLVGDSSRLYAELYAQGKINRSFGVSPMFYPGICSVMFSGESRDPETVASAVRAAAERLMRQCDSSEFERVRRSLLGLRLRAFDSFETICREQAEAHFYGGSFLEFQDIFASITCEDVQEFLGALIARGTDTLSIISPKEDAQ